MEIFEIKQEYNGDPISYVNDIIKKEFSISKEQGGVNIAICETLRHKEEIWDDKFFQTIDLTDEELLKLFLWIKEYFTTSSLGKTKYERPKN